MVALQGACRPSLRLHLKRPRAAPASQSCSSAGCCSATQRPAWSHTGFARAASTHLQALQAAVAAAVVHRNADGARQLGGDARLLRSKKGRKMHRTFSTTTAIRRDVAAAWRGCLPPADAEKLRRRVGPSRKYVWPGRCGTACACWPVVAQLGCLPSLAAFGARRQQPELPGSRPPFHGSRAWLLSPNELQLCLPALAAAPTAAAGSLLHVLLVCCPSSAASRIQPPCCLGRPQCISAPLAALPHRVAAALHGCAHGTACNVAAHRAPLKAAAQTNPKQPHEEINSNRLPAAP